MMGEKIDFENKFHMANAIYKFLMSLSEINLCENPNGIHKCP